VRVPFLRPRAPREPRREVPPTEPLTKCPRCSAPLEPDQDWCLRCGLAARTRLAPTPDWRIPLAAAIVAGLLGAGGLAFAFVELTSDNGPVVTTTTTTATTPPTTTTATTPTTTATTPTTTTPSTTGTETTGGTGAQP
jgi:hypothetical protein